MQGMKSGLLLLLPSLALTGNQWNITLPGGSTRFQDLIMTSFCHVEADDRQMTVNLGQISSNRFYDVGEDSNPIPFAIRLQDCSTTIDQHVGVAPHGAADGKSPDVPLIDEGPGTASGISIALFDSQGQQLLLNRPPGRWASFYRRLTTLNFVAEYRVIGRQITGGATNIQAWFSLTYQQLIRRQTGQHGEQTRR